MKSIQLKLIVTFSTLILLITVGIGLIAVFQANKTAEDMVVTTFTDTLKSSTQMLRLYLNEQFGELSSDDGMLVDSEGESIEGRDEYLNNFAQNNGMVATVFAKQGEEYTRILTTVTDSQGNLALNTNLDPSGEAYARISQGSSYYGSAQILDGSYFTAYEPIMQDGEVIGIYFVGIALDDVETIINAGNSATIFAIAIAVVVLLCVGVACVIIISKKMVEPIKHITEVAQSLSNGEFHHVVQTGSNDEVGQLSDAFSVTVDNLQQYIEEIGDTLKMLSEGDLRVKLNCNYVGDFEKLRYGFEHLVTTMNDVMSDIEKTSGLLRQSSVQISGGAQTLASGSVQQAASIEQLSATMEDITGQMKITAQHFETVNEQSNIARENVSRSSHHMNEMTRAMNHINNKANEIQNIVKTIDDIAFQTNILALNAAVEAARAGQYGKGFAVVADEVRTFAGKSAEAARMTAELIEQTSKAVQEGTLILGNTSESLTAVVESTDKINSLMEEIGSSATLQVLAVDQINTGIGQIADVVHSNSGTAQESATASSQLSNLSDELYSRLAMFKFRDK